MENIQTTNEKNIYLRVVRNILFVTGILALLYTFFHTHNKEFSVIPKAYAAWDFVGGVTSSSGVYYATSSDNVSFTGDVSNDTAIYEVDANNNTIAWTSGPNCPFGFNTNHCVYSYYTATSPCEIDLFYSTAGGYNCGDNPRPHLALASTSRYLFIRVPSGNCSSYATYPTWQDCQTAHGGDYKILKICADGNCSPPISRSIEILYPQGSSTIANDPLTWEIQATSTAQEFMWLLVQYSTSSLQNSNPTAVDQTGIYSDMSMIDTTFDYNIWNVPVRRSLLTLSPSTSTDWYVKAYLFTSSPKEGDTPLATSVMYRFTMHKSIFSIINSNPCSDQYGGVTCGNNIPNPVLPPPSTSSSTDNSFCDSDATGTCKWYEVGCETGIVAEKIARWSLCLQPFAKNSLDQVSGAFKKIPVVNMFTSMDAIIQNEVSPNGELLVAGSGTRSMMEQYDHLNIPITIPGGSGSDTPTTFELISSSSWQRWSDQDFHDKAFKFQDVFFVLTPIGIAFMLYYFL